MPIRPENKARYPKNWKEIVAKVQKRSGDRCEFYRSPYGGMAPKYRPRMYRCNAKNGLPHPDTGSKVVLTTAHLDHMPENNSMTNLRHGCQRCHNQYDAPMRRAGIKQRARDKAAAGDLLENYETPF